MSIGIHRRGAAAVSVRGDVVLTTASSIADVGVFPAQRAGPTVAAPQGGRTFESTSLSPQQQLAVTYFQLQSLADVALIQRERMNDLPTAARTLVGSLSDACSLAGPVLPECAEALRGARAAKASLERELTSTSGPDKQRVDTFYGALEQSQQRIVPDLERRANAASTVEANPEQRSSETASLKGSSEEIGRVFRALPSEPSPEAMLDHITQLNAALMRTYGPAHPLGRMLRTQAEELRNLSRSPADIKTSSQEAVVLLDRMALAFTLYARAFR